MGWIGLGMGRVGEVVRSDDDWAGYLVLEAMELDRLALG